MINLKVTLGTVNYTDYLHVTASKVSAPSVIVWEDWIDVPVTNYNFIIPNLAPENYYVRYYDAPDNSSLGTLVAELIVNALTSEVVSERRYYRVGGSGDYDPSDGDISITDPYLIDKDVTGVFKEGFRYLVPTDEWSFDSATGKIDILTGVELANGEVISVDLKYNVGVNPNPATPIGLFTSTIDVTTPTYTLTGSDIDKRVRCAGSASTQVITLISLASISENQGIYFDNRSKGVAVQVKLLTSGSDKIRCTGFMSGSNEFDEFWVSKGEQFKLIKSDDGYWEVIGDYPGFNVGERIASGYRNHPNTLPENGALIDGDEYPRLWWWLNNVLPANHKYTSATADSHSFTHAATRRGQFCLHTTLKKFRMPDTTGLTDKGLKDFNSYGSDTERTVDYPGGYQSDMVGPHTHPFRGGRNGGIDSNPNGGGIRQNDLNPFTFNSGYVLSNDGTETRVKNNGVIYLRRI